MRSINDGEITKAIERRTMVVSGISVLRGVDEHLSIGVGVNGVHCSQEGGEVKRIPAPLARTGVIGVRWQARAEDRILRRAHTPRPVSSFPSHISAAHPRSRCRGSSYPLFPAGTRKRKKGCGLLSDVDQTAADDDVSY